MSFVPSNEWWLRVLDFPGLLIAVAVAIGPRRLRRAGESRTVVATFNANLPAGFRWPMDHVFVTDEFTLCALERPGDIGSDHVPLLVDVVL